jgi:DegV family protein with EDD domain
MIRIVSDTDSNMPQDVMDEYGIPLVAIYYMFSQETFRDRYDMPNDEFYRRLVKAKQLPTTSQPAAKDFEKVYREILAETPDATIISIHLSADLSGTIRSAQQAASLIEGADIRHFDTRTASLSQSFMVREAAEMARNGASADEIIAHLEVMRERVDAYFVLDTLEYLAKGGRIGRATHLVGSMLNIKPILTVRDGMVSSFSRQRTRKRAVAEVKELALETLKGKNGVHLGVMYTVCLDEAEQLADELRNAINPAVFMLSEVGPGLGIHLGPNVLAAAWYAPPQ